MNGSKKHQKGEMPNMNKKITSLFLIAFFALAACSQQTENTTLSTESENESQKEQEAHSEKLAHWSYEGESGPEHWGELDPTYSTCVDGSEQSPINIEFSQVDTSESMKILKFSMSLLLFPLLIMVILFRRTPLN